jgi:hypothetical protein
MLSYQGNSTASTRLSFSVSTYFPRLARIFPRGKGLISGQNLNLLSMWQRLQFAKSFAPNVRCPLWQAAQLFTPAGAKCMAAAGEDT